MTGASNLWQPKSEREKRLTRGAVPSSQSGLEIGALHSPIVPQGLHEVYFVDYADTPTLKERHARHPDRVARMVKVDFVWPGSGSLAEIAGKRDFIDYVIASHVIEHVPNMLGWFRGIADVMKTGAVFNLACPDKRYTFDIKCPDSTVGQLIEADLNNYLRPSVRQMFDHCYYAKAIEPGEIWKQRIDVSKRSAFSGEKAPDLAMHQAREIANRGVYYDSHCWIFTPWSFLDLLEGACRVSDFPLVLDDFTPTPPGGFEFYLSFRKPNATSQSELRRQQIDSCRAFRSAYDDQLRALSLQAE